MTYFIVVYRVTCCTSQCRLIRITVRAVTVFVTGGELWAGCILTVVMIPLTAAVVTFYTLVSSPSDRDQASITLKLLAVQTGVLGRKRTTYYSTAVTVVVRYKQDGVAFAVDILRFSEHR
jgi:hypothetical protein